MEAAGHLLGARLVRDAPGQPRRTGRIVEVEAYLGPDDLASHARFGRTARVATMYGPAGRAYVYRVYGMYACLNVVTGPAGVPCAVLIRAVAPLDGEGAFRTARLGQELNRRRSTRTRGADPVAEAAAGARVARLPFARLASGPGLVGAAFDIDTSLDGLDLCDRASTLRLEPAPADEPAPEIRATARIGVGYAGPVWSDRQLRFLVARDPSVSGPGPRR